MIEGSDFDFGQHHHTLKLCVETDEASGMYLNAHLHIAQNAVMVGNIPSFCCTWAGHVARMGRRGTLIDYWWESQRERDH
jgi:hypothetical protein